MEEIQRQLARLVSSIPSLAAPMINWLNPQFYQGQFGIYPNFNYLPQHQAIPAYHSNRQDQDFPNRNLPILLNSLRVYRRNS